VKNLKWAWNNGRRFQVCGIAVAFVSCVLTWFVSVAFAPLTILAVVATTVWGIGYDRGHKRGMKLILDSQIEALERARAVAGEHSEGEGELAMIAPVADILAGLHAHRDSLR
jgi:hypothetical protein